MKEALTDQFIKTLRPPATGRIEVADTTCRGLVIRVTSANIRSWSFRFRDPKSGRVTRQTFSGSYPKLSLKEARRLAEQSRAGIAGGKNPVEEKRRERREAQTRTFEALAGRYIEEHARRHKRTHQADERALRLHVLPKWGTRRFDAIGRGDVIELCEGIVATGKPTQANRVQSLISKIFSFAVDAELVGNNPCARLKKRAKEHKGTRVLSDEEIRLFWHRIGEPPNSTRLGKALQVVLLTGVRVTELAGAEIKEFNHLGDPNKAAWTIPASRSKNGKAHFVPLCSMALVLVADLVALAAGRSTKSDDAVKRPARFLLESPGNPDKPIEGHALTVAMTRFGGALDATTSDGLIEDSERDAAKSWVEDRPTAHDLRRTLATRLAASGVPGEDVSACLNHARKGVTAMHYDQYDRAAEKRRALDRWAFQIGSILNEPGVSNVVPLKVTS